MTISCEAEFTVSKKGPLLRQQITFGVDQPEFELLIGDGKDDVEKRDIAKVLSGSRILVRISKDALNGTINKCVENMLSTPIGHRWFYDDNLTRTILLRAAGSALWELNKVFMCDVEIHPDWKGSTIEAHSPRLSWYRLPSPWIPGYRPGAPIIMGRLRDRIARSIGEQHEIPFDTAKTHVSGNPALKAFGSILSQAIYLGVLETGFEAFRLDFRDTPLDAFALVTGLADRRTTSASRAEAAKKAVSVLAKIGLRREDFEVDLSAFIPISWLEFLELTNTAKQ